MPLITRRSSTRSLPRTSVGKCGSICRHCSSDSQNKLLRIAISPNRGDGIIFILIYQEGYWVLTLNTPDTAQYYISNSCPYTITFTYSILYGDSTDRPIPPSYSDQHYTDTLGP